VTSPTALLRAVSDEDQLTGNNEIGTEQVPLCLQCGTPGRPLYSGLSDRLFGAPGAWGHLECPGCALVWLNPRPIPNDLGKIYRTYYTHGRRRPFASLRENLKRGLYATVPGYESAVRRWGWRLAGTALSWLPGWKERAVLATMCLNGAKKGKLIDIGCGDGGFLSIMRDAGWEVAGIEPDPLAAKFAEQSHSIRVIANTLPQAQLADQSVDAVTLSHVIEHAADPIGLLRECRRILRPGGKVIVVTPNLAGHGHRDFRDSWVHLDPPRHFYLFSPATLRSCCELAGLHVELLRTSTRTAAWVWTASDTIRQKGYFNRDQDFTWRRRVEGMRLLLREEISRRTSNSDFAGEELVLIAGSGASTATQSAAAREIPRSLPTQQLR
jgi:2-polyprenyl-3-methyl-5-hydroxy-6-metoxy-1,4-benzoquinol methylase